MSALQELLEVVECLRGPEGCPWDKEQTHESLRGYLVEECAELAEAIDNGDYEHMVEELGDVLFQVIFHSAIGEDAGRFSLEDVAGGIRDKLVRRHPHVFGDVKVSSSEEVFANWNAIKAEEKAAKGVVEEPLFKKHPPALPVIYEAVYVCKQLKKHGLGGEGAQEIDEEGLGAALYELAERAQGSGLDPERALKRYLEKKKAGVGSV